MEELSLQTIYEGEDCTLSKLNTRKPVAFDTLELPWKNNQNNISCIPEGRYQCVPHYGSNPWDAECWMLIGVPGRSGILIHIGNIAANSKGCILIGLTSGTLNGQKAVLHSADALEALKQYIGRDEKGKLLPFWLTVVRM